MNFFILILIGFVEWQLYATVVGVFKYIEYTIMQKLALVLKTARR